MKKFLILFGVLIVLALALGRITTTDGESFYLWQWNQAVAHACHLADGEYVDGHCLTHISVEESGLSQSYQNCGNVTVEPVSPDDYVNEFSRGLCTTYQNEVTFGLDDSNIVYVDSSVDLSLDLEDPDCWQTEQYHYCTEITDDSLIVTITPR